MSQGRNYRPHRPRSVGAEGSRGPFTFVKIIVVLQALPAQII